MRINIIPIRELIIPIIPIRFRIANTNRSNLSFYDYLIRLIRCQNSNNFRPFLAELQ